MPFARTFALTLGLATSALAQDTAGAWAPTFTARHAAWDVTCDARGANADREERCYIRHIDIYAPRPNFGVVFLFLDIREGSVHIALGREFETDLVADVLKVAPGWARPEGLCSGGPCEITGADATSFANALAGGGTLEIGFEDATGMKRLRRWSSEGFAAAYDDVRREAAERGL